MFGILGGLIAVPAITATTEAVRQGQRQNAREEHRGRKSHLVVNTPFKHAHSAKFDGSLVVLKNNKLYIDTAANQLGSKGYHPFTGYYLPHPENQSAWKTAGWRGEGMVSTISDDPPYLNWIYLDRFTYEVKYGNKYEAAGHLMGPWDCTEIDKRVTFEGWEGFMAVQEEEGSEGSGGEMWALYFDKDDNFLSTREDMPGSLGKRKMQVQLSRRERPRTKEEEEQDRREKVERRNKKEQRERRRSEERKMPLSEVFKKDREGGDAGGDDFDVKVRHVEEIDE